MTDVRLRPRRECGGLPADVTGARAATVDIRVAARAKPFSPQNPTGFQSASPGGVRERYEDALVLCGSAATVSACPGEQEPVTQTLQPTLTLGGGLGWHRNEWEPQLKEAAYDIGVELEMRELSRSWWRGTEYELKVSGPQDAVKRFAEKYSRMRRYYRATHA